jgi:tetratricopeptide (TPR) repeat protein
MATSDRPTLLRVLVARRHWQKYETFVTQYVHAAGELAARDHDSRLRGLSIAKRQFERWLAGTVKTVPYPDHCRVLEYLFGYPVEELFSSVSQEAGPPPKVQLASAYVGRSIEPSAAAMVVKETALIGPEANRDRAAGPPGHGDSGQPGSARPHHEGLQRELVMAAHESSEHAGFVASHGLDPTTLEQLQDDVVQLARRYAQTSPLLLYGGAIRVRNLGFQLLGRTKRTDQERDLYLIIGQTCGLLAAASFDLGSRVAATEQARSAWIYGRHIGHNSLCAWARGMQALIEYWSGRPLEAVALVQEGQAYAPPGTALVRLRCVEARAWSHLGDAGQTAQAIGAAWDARDQAGHNDLHDEIGGEFSFDEARQARCNGSAYVMLGDADSAITATRRAIDLVVTLPPERRWLKVEAEAHTDLSAAYLLKGQLDGAHEALAPVFAVPQELRIEGLLQRLGRVRNLLVGGAFRSSREACQLQEQIEEFTMGAANRMLPGSPSHPMS